MSIEQIDRSRTMPGGEVLNEIAFVLLARIIVGTYPSIFIARHLPMEGTIGKSMCASTGLKIKKTAQSMADGCGILSQFCSVFRVIG